jgi:tRNA threonylcarbamoyl adenosine modification protein (Sua5/YciO/YrdC/YwlC family)
METPVTGYFSPPTIRRCARVLSSGGVAVLPTDTVYGFHCLASRSDAISAIYARKGRARRSGLILLAADLSMADAVVDRWPGKARTILMQAWPAPLTAVLPAAASVARPLRTAGTVAVRVPAHDELRMLIRTLGEPLASTSVNLSGEPPMTRIGDIRASFPGLGAYISNRGRASTAASEVVDFTGSAPRIVRRGSDAAHRAIGRLLEQQ